MSTCGTRGQGFGGLGSAGGMVGSDDISGSSHLNNSVIL